MINIFSKGIFFLISFMFLVLSVKVACDKQLFDAVIIFGLVIVSNPVVLDRISKKLGIEKTDYTYALKIIGVFTGTLIAYLLTILIYNNTELKNGDNELENFNAIFKMCVYFIYLLTLFLCKSSEKFSKYIIFGAFYIICVLLSFSSDTINMMLINILNFLSDSDIDNESFNILVQSFLNPIKEAILTYIIFDTVIEKKDGNLDEKNNNVKENVDEVESKNELIDTQTNTFFSVSVHDDYTGKNRKYLIEVNKR